MGIILTSYLLDFLIPVKTKLSNNFILLKKKKNNTMISEQLSSDQPISGGSGRALKRALGLC